MTVNTHNPNAPQVYSKTLIHRHLETLPPPLKTLQSDSYDDFNVVENDTTLLRMLKKHVGRVFLFLAVAVIVSTTLVGCARDAAEPEGKGPGRSIENSSRQSSGIVIDTLWGSDTTINF